jgi:hypothetical protein
MNMANRKEKSTVKRPLILRAGPLSMSFEPELAFLRYIRLGNREILRGIYAAVRDGVWGTITPEISNICLEAEQDHFKLTFDVNCWRKEIDFFWQGSITGDPQGMVVYSMNGMARSGFKSNRIGFCVLHPIQECAGRACLVEKVDGTLERGRFPEAISPHQPFLNMRAISYEVTPAVTAKVCFEGDIFEMEDQRNWSDASFKTYCTPLSLPFPFEVAPGQNFKQTITLSLKGTIPEIPTQATPTAGISFQVYQDVRFRLPDIGLQMASHGRPLQEEELTRLKKLNLHHLRVDLNLSDSAYPGIFARAHSEARLLGIFLEIALFLGQSPDQELRAFLKELRGIKPQVSSWLIFHLGENSTSEKWFTLARRYLSDYNGQAKIGAGSCQYYVDLNRSHPPAELLSLVCYPVNPQVHASDNASIIETLPILAQMAENAHHFMGGIPVAVTPVSLKPRPAPITYSDEPDRSGESLPSWADVRQMSLFGAGWTLGTLKYLSQGGVESISYYETTGLLGIMEASKNTRAMKRASLFPGKVFPIYHVLADVGEYAGGMVLKTVSSDPLAVEGLAFMKGDLLTIILANLTAEEMSVALAGFKSQASIRYLSRDNAELACANPEAYRAQIGELRRPDAGLIHLKLGPYSLAHVETIPSNGKSNRST